MEERLFRLSERNQNQTIDTINKKQPYLLEIFKKGELNAS